MYNRILITVAAVLIAAFTPLWAIPDVPILQVDTLVDLSKTGGGEAGGALFLPDGNIIALWKSIPHVIDSKTGEVIRRMDTVHSSLLHKPMLTTNGLRLGGISMGPKLNVWDVPTGKIIFQTNKKMMSFCFSPDGTKMYVTLPNDADNPGTIAVYEMLTFQEIDRISFPSITYGYHIDISPDGKTLAVSAGKRIDDYIYNQFILIDLNDKKNYTTIESLKSQIYSMEFSPDGKQVAFHYNDGNGDNYIYIYNLETKEKKYIREQELEALFAYQRLLSGHPKFISYNTLSFIFSKYTLVWNTEENKLKKLIKFLPWSISSYNDTLVLINQRGIIGYLNKSIVSVKDLIVPKDNYLAYSNNQLSFYSDKSFVDESMIYDTTGKLINKLGSQIFRIGNNIIPVNYPLLNGTYLLTIINEKEHISMKFMVDR